MNVHVGSLDGLALSLEPLECPVVLVLFQQGRDLLQDFLVVVVDPLLLAGGKERHLDELGLHGHLDSLSRGL